MMQANIPLLIVKLVAGGIAAFFAILLMSKTREIAWMCMTAGIVTSYVGIVYEMLVILGIALPSSFSIFGIPVAGLLFAVLPSIFFAASAIILILKN